MNLIWSRKEVVGVLDIAIASLMKMENEGYISPAFRLPAGKMERVYYDFNKFLVVYLYAKLRTANGYLEKRSFEPIKKVDQAITEQSLNAQHLLIFEEDAQFVHSSQEFQSACLQFFPLVKVLNWPKTIKELAGLISNKLPDDRSVSLEKQLFHGKILE